MTEPEQQEADPIEFYLPVRQSAAANITKMGTHLGKDVHKTILTALEYLEKSIPFLDKDGNVCVVDGTVSTYPPQMQKISLADKEVKII